MTRPYRALAAVSAGAMLVAVLAGCGDAAATSAGATSATSAPPSPSATASPTRSADPAAQLEQDNVAAAEQTLTDFYAGYNDVSHHGWKGWEKLGQYWAPSEVWKAEAAAYQSHVQSGLTAEGASKVASMEVAHYDTPDEDQAGHEVVTIDLCLDNSRSTIYDADGTKVERIKGFPDRFVTTYEVQRMAADAPWLIAGREQKVKQTC